MHLLTISASKLDVSPLAWSLVTKQRSSHAGSVIMKTVYGYDVDPNGDRFVELVDRAEESIHAVGNVGGLSR